MQDNGPGNTALHEASWKGFSRCVQALCAVRGADLSLRNHAGFAPLHLACQNGHNQSCRELLLAGCDPDVRNNYGDTPLHTSARYGHAGVTRILVSAECKVSEQNKNGDTALHIAAAMGRRKLTRILLEAGCTKSLRNKQGETARDIATRKELSEILSILNNPVIPMPRNKDVGKEPATSKENATKKKKKGSGGRSGRNSGSRSGSRGSRSGAGGGPGGVPGSGAVQGGAVQGAAGAAPGAGTAWSPYGCHYYPDTSSFPQPRLDSLPPEPLRKGEQYYLDLAGNIRKGPVGVGYTCYCAPFFRHMEQRLDRDKQDLKKHINQAVEGLERRTQGHISQLTRSLAAERARCSQRHLHLQQWLRGVGGAAGAVARTPSVPRARSVDSLLERPLHHVELDSAAEAADRNGNGDIGEEIEVLSEGDNTARRKESFLRRGGRGKLPRLRPGLSWDLLAEADKVLAATDPTHNPGHDPLLSAARLQSRARRVQHMVEAMAQQQHPLDAGGLSDHPELEVLDERVSQWRGQQRRLMLEVARASREIAQLKRVTSRDRGRGSSGSELESRGGSGSRAGRESRGSRGSRGSKGAGRRLQTLDQVDEGGRLSPGLSSGVSQGPARSSVQYLHAEVHAPPKTPEETPGRRRSRSQELLRVEPAVVSSRSPTPPLGVGAGGSSSPSPSPVPCSPAARAARWHGVSVTAEDIENWRRLDRLRDLEQEQEQDESGGMVTNPDYEVQVEDGIIFSSDLRDLRDLDPRLPPLPQPQQPTAAMRSQQNLVVEPPGPAKAISNAPPPAAAVLHPKPKFATPFQVSLSSKGPQGPKGEVVPLPRGMPAASSPPVGPLTNGAPVPLKRATTDTSSTGPAVPAHVPLRKSVHDMVARIQTHMLNNLKGKHGKQAQTAKAKDDVVSSAAAPAHLKVSTTAGPAAHAVPLSTPREMAIDVGDCVQVQARRVQACHRDDDSESSDGEDADGAPRTGLGLGPDYENVSPCWRDGREPRPRILVSDLPYRSRTAVYSTDVGPDFLDIPLTNGHTIGINGQNHGLNGHAVNGHGMNGHGLNGHGLNNHSLNGHTLRINGHGLGLNGHGHDQDPRGTPNGTRGASHPLTLSHPLSLGSLNGLAHHHSPAGTPDLELEVHAVHGLGHPFHHYPYTAGSGSGSGMYSPDHGDSGYSTRMGGSSNSKGTSPSLSGLDSDGLLQNSAPRSAAALNIANAAAAIVHQRHTNASLV
ncbi:uncharacterized protein LOC113209474 [Frankliniella occidentalis]|uniref:Uncharacterized protein LOC113209474 n=1 Tax=Frankliniella occidentalis TaxID=133901 RepID=A0A9C6X6M6_FRAOC|nr:uncharacterized protein LOC113209474 [Frankliniella occidentalis]